jgi:hypothetical protein
LSIRFFSFNFLWFFLISIILLPYSFCCILKIFIFVRHLSTFYVVENVERRYVTKICQIISIPDVYTVKKKAKRYAGPKHLRDGKFRHPRRSSCTIYVDEGLFRSIYVDEFSAIHMLRVCAMLGSFVPCRNK